MHCNCIYWCTFHYQTNWCIHSSISSSNWIVRWIWCWNSLCICQKDDWKWCKNSRHCHELFRILMLSYSSIFDEGLCTHDSLATHLPAVSWRWSVPWSVCNNNSLQICSCKRDFTQVIFAALLGIIFLGEVPTILSIIGYTIIIGIAIIRWKRNLKTE